MVLGPPIPDARGQAKQMDSHAHIIQLKRKFRYMTHFTSMYRARDANAIVDKFETSQQKIAAMISSAKNSPRAYLTLIAANSSPG